MFGFLSEKVVNLLEKGLLKYISEKAKKKTWDDLFVETSVFLTSSPENRDRLDAALSTAFSPENVKKISAELYNKPGYYFKEVLNRKLNTILNEYELNIEEKSYFINQFIEAVFQYTMKNDRQLYQEYFLGELKKDIDSYCEEISLKLDQIDEKVDELLENNIFTINNIETELLEKSTKNNLRLEHFAIDDEESKEKIKNKIINHENIHIVGKSNEETLYLVLNELKQFYQDLKVYIIKSYKEWEKLRLKGISNCVLIPYFNDEVHAIKNNINIFIYNDNESCADLGKIVLKKRLKKNIIKALEDYGYSNEESYKIFNLTNGLFVPLKKHLFDFHKTLKYDFERSHLKYICVALLFNQWTEEEGDKELISEILNCTYDEFVDIIDQYIAGENPLFIKRKGHINSYRLTSLYDGWEEFGRKITDSIWEKFLNKISIIFEDIEPSIQYSIEGKYISSITAPKCKYTENIKIGILKSLIMKKNYVPNDDRKILRLISESLRKIMFEINSIEKYANFSSFICDVVEIEPKLVLDFISKSIEDDEFIKLCEIKSDSFFGKHYYVNYLWALDKLLFMYDYQVEAIELLLKWDSKKLNFAISNSPKERLLDIFCSWYNVIPMDLELKKQIAEEIIGKYDGAWDILSNNLPNCRNSISLNCCKPMYINVDDFEPHQVDGSGFFVKYFELCMKYCDNSNKLLKLIKKMKYYSKDTQNKLIEIFYKMKDSFSDEEAFKFKLELKDIVYRNRFHNDAEWAMNEEKLVVYVELHNSIELKNKIYEYTYLFKRYHEFPILNPVSYTLGDWIEKNDELREIERKLKIKEFINNGYSVLELVKLCDYEDSNLGWYIAKIFDCGKYNEESLKMLIEYSPKSNLIQYVSFFKFNDFDEFKKIIKLLIEYGVSSKVIADILANSFLYKELFEVISTMSDEIKNIYWKNHLIIDPSTTDEEVKIFIEQGIKYGSFASCVQLIYHSKDKMLPSNVFDYILTILDLIDEYSGNYTDDYCLEEILKIAQQYAIASNDDGNIYKIAMFEVIVYNIIKYENMKCYNLLIKSNPRLYASLLYYIFKSEDGREKNVDLAEKLSSLYINTKFCPSEKDGKVVYDDLLKWITSFKSILEEQKQVYLYKSTLGGLFVFSPIGEDGYMPCEAVREIIEKEFDDQLMTSYVIAEMNKRSIYTPNAGVSENIMAKKYKENANNIRVKYPKTARIFDELFEKYIGDSDVERKIAEEE